MSRLIALAAFCLLLSGCVYYPYGGGGYGYGYGYSPGYRYGPPAYGYPPPAYGGPVQPYYPATGGYPRTLGPNGDTAGQTGG